MPWKECHVEDDRLRFVARLLDDEKMAPLCQEFGISRKTGYKIFDRYQHSGVQGLTDRSRRPATAVSLKLERDMVRRDYRLLLAIEPAAEARDGVRQTALEFAREAAADGQARLGLEAREDELERGERLRAPVAAQQGGMAVAPVELEPLREAPLETPGHPLALRDVPDDLGHGEALADGVEDVEDLIEDLREALAKL